MPAGVGVLRSTPRAREPTHYFCERASVDHSHTTSAAPPYAVEMPRPARSTPALALVALLGPANALAGQAAHVPNPFAARGAVVHIDVAAGTVNGRPTDLAGSEPVAPIRFDQLDEFAGRPPLPADRPADATLPPDLVQRDDMVMPRAVAEGAQMVGDLDLLGAPRPLGAPADNCAYPDAVPPGIYVGDSRRGGEVPRRGTVFLNFTGGVLNTGGENSAENRSGIARSGHEYPPFSGGETKAIAVAQAVQQDFATWAIRVVYDPRPPKLLPYTMAMVGGHYTDTSSGPASGVAPIDCEDFGQRNVCYSFTNGEPATSQANVISQEVAHTYGLEHTYGGDRIMSYEGGGDKIFGSNCQETFALPNQASGCQGVNKCHCGDPDRQNDASTIGFIYAAAGPDNEPPTIALTAPPDGSTFAEGEEIIVDFDPNDDFGGYGWKLMVENEGGELLVDQADYDRALTFKINGLPPGVYTFTGVVMDHADQTGTHAITVTVTSAPGGDASSGGADESGGPGGSSGSGGAAGTASDDGAPASEDSGGAGQVAGSDDGCACVTSAGRTGTSSLGLLAMLLGLRARRRR